MLKDTKDKWISLHDFCGDLRHKWRNRIKYNVILSFWATYCHPCKKEIPELEKTVMGHQGNTKLLLVNIDKEGKRIVEPFLKKHQYESDVLLDAYRRTAKKYGVNAVPAMFLIDKKGIIRYVSYGYDEEKGTKLLADKLKELDGIGTETYSDTTGQACKPKF